VFAVSRDGDAIVATRAFYGSKVHAEVEFPAGKPVLLLLRPTAWPPAGGTGSATTTALELGAAASRARHKEFREVAKGGRYVHPELGARLVAAETEAARRAEEDPLSDREREVLRLLALGHTNQEIAKQLYISVRTAETHRAHIMQKLRLSSRAELVRHALAQGLLED